MTALKYSKISVNLTSPKGKKNIPVVVSGCTLFFNAQHYLIELTAHERALFDYLCEQMISKDNSVTVDTKMKQAFISDISNITGGKHSPSIKRVTVYTSKLVELGLLILMGSQKSDFYCVNPKYVFKGAVTRRLALLKYLIEERNNNGLPINMLINTAL